jgi:hypothetical protein
MLTGIPSWPLTDVTAQNERMERRKFLGNMGRLGLVLTLPLSDMRLTNSETQPKLEDPDVLVRIGPNGFGLWSLISQFIVATGSAIVANEVSKWLSTRHENERAQMSKVHTSLASQGFLDFRYSNVSHQPHNIHFYYVGGQDRLNGYTVFVASPRAGQCFVAAMVGGPVMAGLTFAANDWFAYCRQSGCSISYGLFPLQQHHEAPCVFQRSMARPFVSRTQAGQLEVNYVSFPQKSLGRVSVVSRSDNGGLLFGRDYTLSYA